MRSSFSKGRRDKHYPYYLCQTKGCASDGKSVARDRLENQVGDTIKDLEPSRNLMALARLMFRHAWDRRVLQAEDAARSAKRHLAEIDKQISALLDRIMTASNTTIIATYEDKITQLEQEKARMTEKVLKQTPCPGLFEEKPEPALTFLASP